jgi:uncharacterized protein (TIGR03067 family)
MKKQLALVAVALSVGLLAAADKPDSDAKKLEGTWKIVSAKLAGQAADDVAGDQLIFKGGKLTYKAKDGDHVSTFKLTPAAKPAQIDLVPEDGDTAGKTLKGIYALEKDGLKLCINLDPNGDRPAKFVSADGSRVVLATLKR